MLLASLGLIQVMMFYIVIFILVWCTYVVKSLECPEGKFYNKYIVLCKNCTKCKAGNEIEAPCSKYTDTRCKPCSRNWFSSDGLKCHRCSRCPVGATVAFHCNMTLDTKCTSKSTESSITSEEVDNVWATDPKITKPHTSVPPEPTVKTEIGIKIVVIVLGTLLIITAVAIVWLCVVKPRRKARSDSALSVETSELEVMLDKPSATQSKFNELLAELKVRNICMSEVTTDLYEDLGHLLNPEGWRMLSGKLGFIIQETSFFGMNSTTSCQDMLARWATKRDATLYVLAFNLNQMGREDCLEKIQKYWNRNRTTNV